MNDLETQLQDALDLTAERVPVSEDAWLRNEQLLHELPRRRSRTTWMVLATAACVFGVLVAVAVLALPGGHKAVPAGPTPTPSPTSTPSPATTPGALAPTPSNGQASSLLPPVSPEGRVFLGGASVVEPEGWAPDFRVSIPDSRPILSTVCLTPDLGTASPSRSCPIAFSSVDTGKTTQALSVDTEGGLQSNPEYCGPGGVAKEHLDYADSHLGTRPADYRHWEYTCKDGTSWSIEQYVADNAPGFVLFSDHATPEVHALMAYIAKTANLPEISAPLRLSDFGIVRSVEPTAGGYHVLLDRVVQGVGGIINNNSQTYPYDVPARILRGGYVPKVGDKVVLKTNGEVVRSFFIEP